MSQITSPDILNIEYLDTESEEFNERKVITLSEIAHFVRCIPFKNNDRELDV